MILTILSRNGVPAQPDDRVDLKSQTTLLNLDDHILLTGCSNLSHKHLIFDVALENLKGETCLIQRNAAVACSINGTGTVLNHPSPLERGDIVEIGLNRFRVDTTEPGTHENTFHSDDAAELMKLAGESSSVPLFDVKPESREAASEDRSVPDDPLEKLGMEYRDAITLGFRTESVATPRASSSPAQCSAPFPDPFDQHGAGRRPGTLVTDLLGKRQGIDTLIASLDCFGHAALFEEEPKREILALLAPPGTRVAKTAAGATLTLQEHHRMSMDSAFHPGSAHAEATS
jgi:hypothetical protein